MKALALATLAALIAMSTGALAQDSSGSDPFGDGCVAGSDRADCLQQEPGFGQNAPSVTPFGSATFGATTSSTSMFGGSASGGSPSVLDNFGRPAIGSNGLNGSQGTANPFSSQPMQSSPLGTTPLATPPSSTSPTPLTAPSAGSQAPASSAGTGAFTGTGDPIGNGVLGSTGGAGDDTSDLDDPLADPFD